MGIDVAHPLRLKRGAGRLVPLDQSVKPKRKVGVNVLFSPHTREPSEKAIADALDRLYEDRELLARRGKAARQRVEEVYVLDKLGDRLLGINESVLRIKIRDGMIEFEDSANYT